MSLLYTLLKWLDGVKPATVAHAHCDIPCGIYDPHHAQVAAHTVVRMNMLINDLPKPGADDPREVQDAYHHKIARFTATKEQHAEIAKHEVRILWGDYFKPEHVKDHPKLHDAVWHVMKTGSKSRQELGLAQADALLKATNEIAEIFWKTKGVTTARVKAPYPTEREFVMPKLG